MLALCAGIGGIECGLRLAGQICGFTPRTICMVEKEVYAAAVLAKEMEAGSLDAAPIWSDIKTFPEVAYLFRGKVDIITGGYPCQPFSAAGQRKGVEDERHIFPHICEIIKAVEPALCFFENVGGHLSLGFPEVYQSLRDLGFAVEAGLFGAFESTGSPHQRQRLFILAYRTRELYDWGWHTRQGGWGEFANDSGGMGHTNRPRPQGWQLQGCECTNQLPAWPPGPTDAAWAGVLQRWPELAPAVAYGTGKRQHKHCQQDGQSQQSKQQASRRDNAGGCGAGAGQETQSQLRRVADGFSLGLEPDNRIDRLRALGNAVVPSCAAVAFIDLMWRRNDTERDCPENSKA